MLGKTIYCLQSDFEKKEIRLKTRKRTWPVVIKLYQVLLEVEIEVLKDVTRMLLAIVEWPFNSSSTTWRISWTSSWVLNWKRASLLVKSFLRAACNELGGSRGVVQFFQKDIFRVTVLVNGDRKPDSEADWHQNDGIVKLSLHSTCFPCWKTQGV